MHVCRIELYWTSTVRSILVLHSHDKSKAFPSFSSCGGVNRVWCVNEEREAYVPV